MQLEVNIPTWEHRTGLVITPEQETRSNAAQGPLPARTDWTPKQLGISRAHSRALRAAATARAGKLRHSVQRCVPISSAESRLGPLL